MKTILITGASGLLGSHLILAAKKKEYRIIGVSNSNSILVKDIETIKTDLTKECSLDNLHLNITPNIIIHAAALTNVDECQNDLAKALAHNVFMTRNMALYSKKHRAKFVYISTDSVFDGEKGNYRESDQTNPLNNYANTKLLGEKESLRLCPDHLIVRTNFYGWSPHKPSISDWMIQKLSSNQQFLGFDDVVFSPLLVNQLADIVIRMIDMPIQGIYHVGASNACSKYQFGIWLAKVFGFDSKKIKKGHLSDVNLQALRPKNTSLNVQNLETKLKEPMPTIISGLTNLRQLQSWSQLLKS